MSQASPHPEAASFAGTLFVLAAPSGAGKSSLVAALLERQPALKLSISHTTRAPRPGEADGREYHFTSPEAFRAAIAAGEFLEWAEVHGNLYGTSAAWIARQMAEGHDILLEIDWQGARQVRRWMPDAVGVFILPPSIAVLEERLRGRGQDDESTITRRVAAAAGEIAHADEFDYVIINQSFASALEELEAVVTASRRRYARQRARHAGLFASFGLGPA